MFEKPYFKKQIVLNIGHTANQPGATNETYGLSEFQYNSWLALKISDMAFNIVDIKLFEQIGEYRDLPYDINKKYPMADAIISLHCNAFDKKTFGAEVLYNNEALMINRNKLSIVMASILQDSFVKILNTEDRGTKIISEGDRGDHLLRNTNAPCVIAEPFFIDNDKEFKKYTKGGMNLVALAYVRAICDIVRIL